MDKPKLDKRTVDIIREWLAPDRQPRLGDHEIIKMREGLLEKLTTREAILLGAKNQRAMTHRIFDIWLHLNYILE